MMNGFRSRLTQTIAEMMMFDDDWNGMMTSQFQAILDGCLNEKRDELRRIWDEVGWRLRPCQNELDCRRTVVSVLKQMRGEAKWNGPDDQGKQFNWGEDLHLSQWDGTWVGKRIQVDGNGMITVLCLNKLGMRGELIARHYREFDVINLAGC